LAPTAIALFEELRAHARAVEKALGVAVPWVMASGTAHDGRYDGKSLGHALRRLQRGPDPALALRGVMVTPHDLRRTVRTHLGETLGVPPHVAERVLGHSLGRIVRTYDRGDYLAERRAALERWDAFVQRLVTGAGADVVSLPAAGRQP
jgi:integrase